MLPLLVAAVLGAAAAQDTTLLASGATWKYYDTAGGITATIWKDVTFGDGTWKSGVSPLGYGAPQVKTAVANGGTTTYYRTSFNLAAVPPGESYVTLSLTIWDGGVVYVNGKEVGRVNMPATAVVGPTTAASSQVNAATAPGITTKLTLATKSLIVGKNTLAIEVHRFAKTPTQSLLNAVVVLTAIPTPSRTRSVTRSVSITRSIHPTPSTTQSRRPSPSFTPLPSSQFIALSSIWKYQDTGADLGTAWRVGSTDDSTWTSGRGILGAWSGVGGGGCGHCGLSPFCHLAA